MSTLQRQQHQVSDALRRVLQQMNIAEEVTIALEVPREKQHGDLSTNVAMQLARLRNASPRAIAEQIVALLDTQATGIERIAIAGPGFINFYMDKSVLYRIVHEVISRGEHYGKAQLASPPRYLVEFVSANPTGSLHLGHARGAAMGDALCRLLAYAGYDVTREYYINDAGNQVANLVTSLEVRYRQALGLDATLPEDGYHGEDLVAYGNALAQQYGATWLEQATETRETFFRTYALECQLKKIRIDLADFRVLFERWTSETSLYEEGGVATALAQLRSSAHVYEHEGALWLRTTTFGDDKDRVLIKNDGTYTYLLPDIAYHLNKYRRGYTRMINIWGADHHGYVARVKAALQALGEDASKLTVLIVQMVSLYQGGEKVKMSKRTGKAITLADLLQEVGVDAARYFFAMRSTDSHLDFDMDLAISTSSDNPVYYVQYAHARMCSIFRQADARWAQLPAWDTVDLSLLQRDEEFELLRMMGEFPALVQEAAAQLAPHRIIRYAYELATVFHRYYKAERVLTDDEPHTWAKLALYAALRHTFRNVLDLVGVEAPEVM
jgi:arginyl-tRNA synthetase